MTTQICSNCGIGGHFYKECTEPITSLGIIAFKRKESQAQWLLVRRRVSIGFIEILRGKYRSQDEIKTLVEELSLNEKGLIQTTSFDDLWNILWNGPPSRRYQSEFEKAKQKFNTLISSGTLQQYCLESKSSWMDTEWILPKGRRSSSESEITCALRETFEEAGVPAEKLKIIESIPPFIDEYVGSNSICYRCKYWLAEADPSIEVCVDSKNSVQQREISDVRWFSFEEACAIIRPHHLGKLQILKEANEIISKQ